VSHFGLAAHYGAGPIETRKQNFLIERAPVFFGIAPPRHSQPAASDYDEV
jgi:hypothetical protein